LTIGPSQARRHACPGIVSCGQGQPFVCIRLSILGIPQLRIARADSSWNIQFNRSISQLGNRDGIDWLSRIAGTKSRTPEYRLKPIVKMQAIQ
jgi:hypothetical protein